MSNSQKSPGIQTGFYNLDQEAGINLAIRQMVAALITYATTYGITWYGAAYRRVDSDGREFPALYQLNSKDWIDGRPNDQWKGYGFFDMTDPKNYRTTNPLEDVSRSRYSHITQQVALVVYGDIDKLIKKQGLTTSVDYRYNLQQIESEIVKVLQRKFVGVRGSFNLQNVYSQKITDVFKTFSITDRGEYIYLPKFGLRFEGELTVTEACNQ